MTQDLSEDMLIGYFVCGGGGMSSNKEEKLLKHCTAKKKKKIKWVTAFLMSMSHNCINFGDGFIFCRKMNKPLLLHLLRLQVL